MCYEVKKDMTLDQGQLQSMISGEPVSIMRKNKIALNVVWTVPGMLAGNEVASWVDNSGSMSRRVVMATFDRRVKVDMVDPHMDSKIKAQIGTLLHKCACACNAAVHAFGERDIWGSVDAVEVDEDGTERVVRDASGRAVTQSILPKYFHAARERFQLNVDPLMAFLRNDQSVRICDALCGMPFDRFKQMAERYFQTNPIKHFRWVDTKYKIVFDDMGITLHKIDREFIRTHNGPAAADAPHPVFKDHTGNVHNLAMQWLCGVAEAMDGLSTGDAAFELAGGGAGAGTGEHDDAAGGAGAGAADAGDF